MNGGTKAMERMNASRIAAAKEGSGLDDGGGHGLGVGGGVRVSKVQHPELTQTITKSCTYCFPLTAHNKKGSSTTA